MKKIFIILLIVICMTEIKAEALSNSSEAFFSLPFGHTFTRTQKRMEKSGAKVLTPRKDSLTMEGFFEGYPATFVFGFYKNKVLSSKAVYLQSMGNAEYDRNFYEAFQKGLNASYGSTSTAPSANTRNSKKVILRNVWTPDRYRTITLTYNSEASKRFSGKSLSDKFISVIYKTSKWDK